MSLPTMSLPSVPASEPEPSAEQTTFAHDAPPTTGQWPTGFFRRTWAIARQRCPRCLGRPLFTGRFAMHEKCAQCGWVFKREGGYFLGAMYFSYPLAVAFILGFGLVLHLLFPEWTTTRLFFGSWVLMVPFVPMIFRYSRTAWMHLDVVVEDLVRGTL